MNRPMTNPFAPATIISDERGVFADGAVRRRAWFVYRVIEFSQPFVGELVYDGWWFRQKVMVDGITLWWRISWVSFHKQIDFRLPAEIDPDQRAVRIQIDFGRGLSIRRFQVSVDGMIAYDEIA
jgi:hypothetical protein